MSARKRGSEILSRLQFLVLVGLSAIVLVLVLVSSVLPLDTRQMQSEIAANNQYIQQSLQLEPIYQSLVRSLAEQAVTHEDLAIRELLASEGISVTATPVAAPVSMSVEDGNSE